MMWDVSVLVRLALALLLSGLIGFEREAGGKPAGMRTHILVCLGATLFMLISINAPGFFPGVESVDPGRIAAGVVTGVGFLGAGTIIRAGGSVKGLTTAASIWAVAAIGLAVGIGYYFAAAIATVLALIVLHLPDSVFGWTRLGARSVNLGVVSKAGAGQLPLIEDALTKRRVRVGSVDVTRRGGELDISYRISVRPEEIQVLVGDLSDVEGVLRVTVE